MPPSSVWYATFPPDCSELVLERTTSPTHRRRLERVSNPLLAQRCMPRLMPLVGFEPQTTETKCSVPNCLFQLGYTKRADQWMPPSSVWYATFPPDCSELVLERTTSPTHRRRPERVSNPLLAQRCMPSLMPLVGFEPRTPETNVGFLCTVTQETVPYQAPSTG
jgi:hypothetical protein